MNNEKNIFLKIPISGGIFFDPPNFREITTNPRSINMQNINFTTNQKNVENNYSKFTKGIISYILGRKEKK